MSNFVVNEMKANSQNSLVGIRSLDADEIKYVGGGESGDYEIYAVASNPTPTPSTPSTINPTFSGQPRAPDNTNTGIPNGACEVATNAFGSGLGNRLGGFWGGAFGAIAGSVVGLACPRADSGSSSGYGPDTSMAGDPSNANFA